MKLTKKVRFIAEQLSFSAYKAGVITRADLPWWENVFSPFVVVVSELIERGVTKEATQCAPNCRLRDLVSLVKPVLHDPVFVLPNERIEAKNRRSGRGLCYTSLVTQKPMESAFWKIFCYLDKYIALEFASDVTSKYPPVGYKHREAIKKELDPSFHIYIDLLPSNLFESGLEFRKKHFLYEAGDVHEISPRVLTDEKYVFFLATVKEQGVFLLGMPHGGVYCQRERPSINEQAERACADFFSTPEWASDANYQIPNKRACLAKQIFLKRRIVGFLNGKKRAHRSLLLVLPLEVCSENVYINFFISGVFKEFLDRFVGVYTDLAIRFHPKMGNECRSNLVKKIRGSSSGVCVFLDESTSFFECGLRYYNIFYVNPFATGLMELGQGVGNNFVLFHNAMDMHNGYLRYLRNNCDRSLGLVQGYEIFVVDRKVVPVGYGASYFHPKRYIKQIKKFIREELK